MRNPDVAQPVEPLERGVREKKINLASSRSHWRLRLQSATFGETNQAVLFAINYVSMKEESSQLGCDVPPP